MIVQSNSQTFGNLPDVYENETKAKALAKLSEKDQKNGMTNRCAKVMYSAIVAVLEDFCNQNLEFAEAVLQSKKTVGDCAESIGKSVTGNSISDIEVYRKAAEFYFPGSKVEFQMKLYMCADEKDAPVDSASQKDAVILNLFDLL